MSQMLENQGEQPERKNRFSVSRDAHEEYVGNMAYTMNKLADKIKAGDMPPSVSPPFCPTTGFAYGGASMTRLMLASVEKGYSDDRWLTYKQLQHYRNADFETGQRQSLDGAGGAGRQAGGLQNVPARKKTRPELAGSQRMGGRTAKTGGGGSTPGTGGADPYGLRAALGLG